MPSCNSCALADDAPSWVHDLMHGIVRLRPRRIWLRPDLFDAFRTYMEKAELIVRGDPILIFCGRGRYCHVWRRVR